MLRPMRALISGIACASLMAGAFGQEPMADPDPPRPVTGLQRALWRPERAEFWLLCAESDGRGGDSVRVRVFDPWLNERAASSERMPEGGRAPESDGRLDLPAFAGHRLLASPEGQLILSRRPWESAPRVVWGPGWAAVEVRSTVPLQSLSWRRAGDAQIFVAPIAGEAQDGILQRAHLRGLDAGETIEIALPATRWTFPPAAAPRWQRFVVPGVDPAGPRPTSEWPSD